LSRSDQTGFETALVGALARAGPEGMIGKVRLDGDTLRVVGEKGGELAIPAVQVERIRLVRISGSRLGTTYEARIWRKGMSAPVLLMPPRPPGGYGPVIKGFARHVAAVRGTVMRGPGLVTAIVNLLIMGGSVTLLATGAVLLGVYEGGWGWWLAAAVAVALDFLLLASTLRNRWPRRVRNLDELDRELPSKKEHQP
jgi:hypothetical protein